MPLEIRTIPSMRLASMRHIEPYGHPALTRLWERLGQWCAENGLSEPRPRFYGISHDNPARTPPDQCRYDACVQIEHDLHPGAEVRVLDFIGCEHACMHFSGTGPEIARAWADMFAPGKIPAGWAPAPRPVLELYDEHFAVDPDTGRFACWLCVPVQRIG